MRFIVMVMGTPASEGERLRPTAEQYAAMQSYNKALVRAGILLAAEGLAPMSEASRVRFDGARRTVTDGPFSESREYVAGFSIIQAKSKDEAIEWAKRTPNVFPNGEVVVEIRKLMDVEDFGEHFTPNSEIANIKY